MAKESWGARSSLSAAGPCASGASKNIPCAKPGLFSEAPQKRVYSLEPSIRLYDGKVQRLVLNIGVETNFYDGPALHLKLNSTLQGLAQEQPHCTRNVIAGILLENSEEYLQLPPGRSLVGWLPTGWEERFRKVLGSCSGEQGYRVETNPSYFFW